MTSFDREDKEIIDQLKQLPMIEDRLAKDELYKRASQKLDQQQSIKYPPKLVPILSTLAVIALLIIIVPTVFSPQEEQTRDSADSSVLYESSIASQEQESVSIQSDEDRLLEQEDSAEDSLSGQDVAIAKDEANMTHEPLSVILESGENEAIIYGAVPDQQTQYKIPIAMIVPDDVAYNDAIQALYTQFQEKVWEGGRNLFEHVRFDINQDAGEVIIHFPRDYSIGDGSAIPNLFGQILSEMFTPYHIDRAILQTEDELGVDLGPYGVMSEITLTKGLANYKRYDLTGIDQTLLIPIPKDNESVIEALEDLKHAQEDFAVYETIPEQMQFTVGQRDRELIVNFEPYTDPITEDEMMTMIESILLTAKSYGFNTVLFNDLPMDQLGPYQLTAPIDVPLAVNPIDSY